ncbi:MAG TPA: glycosyltransferase family 2 protein [bacterium]|nr:glycosyltransferase family 2 protein [bacterium]
MPKQRRRAAKRPKVIVVMPAYNAAKTVERTYRDIPKDWVDGVILVDDVSKDDTVEVARRLPIKVVVHRENKGYGGNQKTCYTEALLAGAEVVVMLHPDYQYDSRLIPQMVSPILDGHADFVMGSRIIGEGALKGGMPWWKFVANRALTLVENIILNRKFSDLHTGFRAYSRRLLMDVPYIKNSDDFVFDSQMIAQANFRGYTTTEVPIPTRYFAEASSVNFKTSAIYGVKTLWVMGQLALQKLGLRRYPWLESRLEDVMGRDHRDRIFGRKGRRP